MRKKATLTGLVVSLLLGSTLAIAGCGSESVVSGSANQGNAPQPAPTTAVSQDPAEALAALQAGNLRYVSGLNQQLQRSQDRPLALNSGQAPIAMVLSCADSRVTPELAFDQAWGQLFVVRVAGPVTDTNGVGSFEFGHAVLGSRLLVVLGHEQCGAVQAAFGTLPPGNLGALVQLIVPAAQAALGKPGDPLENAVRANVKLQADQIRSLSPVLDQAVIGGRLVIRGALYHFDTGEIEFLP